MLDIALCQVQEVCDAYADGALPPGANDQLCGAGHPWYIDPAPFAAFIAADALLGPVVRKQPGLRIVQSGTLFER